MESIAMPQHGMLMEEEKEGMLRSFGIDMFYV